jgi:hypothetical protein
MSEAIPCRSCGTRLPRGGAELLCLACGTWFPGHGRGRPPAATGSAAPLASVDGPDGLPDVSAFERHAHAPGAGDPRAFPPMSHVDALRSLEDDDLSAAANLLATPDPDALAIGPGAPVLRASGGDEPGRSPPTALPPRHPFRPGCRGRMTPSPRSARSPRPTPTPTPTAGSTGPRPRRRPGRPRPRAARPGAPPASRRWTSIAPRPPAPRRRARRDGRRSAAGTRRTSSRRSTAGPGGTSCC